MASKQVIETNKLKIGSGESKGLFVGNTESYYAVITDSAKTPTVIYDKVTYNFTVADLATTVPASGQTYTIAASVSTRTHGNGVVDNVTFSPTSITIPANTGSSYTSAVTVTQTTSNLTDQYNFTVAGDAVKSIALTISNPSVIPASGGSVSSCTTSATVTYNSGRQVTSFTPTQVKWGTAVSAGSKGTTVSDQTSAGTLTCYIVYGGVTSNTANVTVYQQANAKTGSGLTTVSITSPTSNQNLGEIAASGGSKTPTLTATGGLAWTSYTSTSSASTTPSKTWNVTFTSGSGFTLKSATTGQISASTKGTTMSNVTTSNTATAKVTVTANGVTQTASTTYYVTQALNHIVSATATTSSTGTQISYANIGPGATSAAPTKNGACTLTYSSGASSKVTSNPTGASIAWNRTYSLASSQNGFTAVNSAGTLTATSLGTTISNARTSAVVTSVLTPVITHTSTYGGAVITATSMSCQVTCTQEGNYVTGITVANQAIAYDTIPAGGGSKTPTGSNGTVTYAFSSKSTTTTAPATSYGSLSSSVSYAMTASGRFTLKSDSTGEVSATTKGTTIENVTSSDTVTKTVSYTWTPTASYNAAGTKTVSGTATTKVKQAGNYVSSLTVTTNPEISYGSAIPASGGTITPTGGVGAVSYNFTSGSNSTTAPTSTYGALTTPTSYAMATGGDSRITLSSTTNGTLSGTTKGTTAVGITSSGTVTKTVTYTWTPSASYNAGGTITKAGTATAKGTQAANAVTSYAWENPVVTFSYPSGNIVASGGTKTPTISATQSGTATYTSTATATTSNTQFTYSYSMPASDGFTLNTSSGVVTAANRTTTLGNARTTNTITVTATGSGSKTGTKTATVTQAANYVVSVAASGTSTNGAHFSYATAPASATTQAVTLNGTARYTYSSGSVGTSAPASGTATYSRTYSLASSSNGFTAVNSAGTLTCTARGTTVGNARTSANITSVLTVTYVHPSGINGGTVTSPTYSKTNTCTQEGNYVTGITVASQALAYSTTIPASGGTSSPSGSNGTVTYAFTSKSTTTSTPASSAGSLTSSVSYAMTETGRFKKSSTNFATDGIVSATTKSTAIENVTSSDTVTKTVSYTWTPATSYNAAGTKTCSGTATSKAKQAGNYVSSLTITTNPSISYASAIPAGGGTINPSGAVGAVSYNFTSGDNSTSAPASTYGALTTPTTYAMATGGDSRITLSSTSNGTLSGTTKGTTAVGVTSSGTVTKTVTYTWTPTTNYNAGGTITKAGTATAKGTQAANAVTSYAWENPVVTLTYPSGNIVAKGGTKTPTVSATQSGTATYTSTATATTSNTQFTYSYAMTTADGFSINTTSGVVTASGRGTTIGNARNSGTITVTATGSGSKTGTKTATVTQEGNYVTSISVSGQAVSIANIGAGGGSKTPTGGNGTVTYTFTSTSTSTSNPGDTYGSLTSSVSYAMTATGRFTLKSTSTGEVSATTKGTDIENVTNANTLTKTVSYTWTPTTSYNAAGTKTCSGTATCTPKQDGNYVSSLVFTTNPTVVYSGAIPASGGTKSDSGTNGAIKVNYTSGSSGTTFPADTYGSSAVTATYAMTSGNGFTITTSTGVVSAGTKGTTVSNITSSNTVTKTVTYTWTPSTSYSAGGTKTVSNNTATGTATQAANSHTDTWNNPVVTLSYPSGNIAASGGTKSPTVSATQSGTATYTSTATATTSNTQFTYSYAMTAANGFTINASTGVVTAEGRGTTIGNARTSNSITVTATGAGSKTGTKSSVTVSQAANYVTSIAASGYSDTTAAHFSYANVGPAATSAPVTLEGTSEYTFSSGSKKVDSSSSPSFGGTASYSRSYTLASSQNGFTSVNASNGTLTCTSLGTTISNARASAVVTGVLTVTYTHASGISGGTITSSTYTSTGTCTQNGNYVTGVTLTSVAVTYAQIAASGGTANDTGSNGTVTFAYSTTATGTTTPASTYGSLAVSSKSYSMTSGNGFTINTSSGAVTAENRGTTSGNTRSSNTITKSVTYTWTPSASYNAVGAKSGSNTGTGTASQEANTLGTTLSNSGTSAYTVSVSIGDGMVASGGTATVTHSAGHTNYGKRTYTSGSKVDTAYTVSDSSTISITTNGNSRFSLNGNTLTHSNMTTNATTDTVVVTAKNSSNTSTTNTASKSITNAITSTTWGNVTISTFTYPTIAAGGGSVTPTFTATQSGTNYFTSGSNAATSNNSFTTTYAYTTLNNFKQPSGYQTTGEVSATTRSTTIGNARSMDVTATTTGAGSKTASATTTVTQAGNYVTAVTISAGTLTYATAPASGGTISETGSDGKISSFKFTSGSSTASVPSGGSTSKTATWTMASGNGFSMYDSSTGKLSAETRGYTYSTTERTSNTVTESVTYKYTHNSTYGGSVVSGSYEKTGYCLQAANTTSETYSDPIVSLDYNNAIIAASGGSQTPAISQAYLSHVVTFASGVEVPESISLSKSYAMTASGRWSLKSSSTGQVSATSRGTTIGNEETSPTITMYYWGTGMSGTGSTTADTAQAGNYVTAITVSTSCVFNGTIPASGGSISESGSDASISKYYFTSGSNTTSKPANTYGSTSAQTTWSMTAGNGFSLSNYTVTASGRGTTTGDSRTSNTITETAKMWWIHSSSYSDGGTISGQTTDTDYCVQEANTYTETYGNVTVTSPSGSLGEIGAGGGSKTPTLSAWQACSKGYSSGSGSSAWTSTSFTWSFNKSAGASLGTGFYFKNASTGEITASTRGSTTGGARTSSTVTAYAYANGKTASTTYYASQEANEMTETYGAISITSPNAGSGSYLGQISASGGSITPTLSAWQACTRGYTSGSGSSAWTSTSFTWSFDKTAGASLGTGFYLKNASTGEITASTRGTSTGETRTSNNVTAYAYANSHTASTYYYVKQQANYLDSWSAHSSYQTTVSSPYLISYAANSTGLTVMGNSGYGWPVYTSGSKGSQVYASALTRVLSSDETWLSVPASVSNGVTTAVITATTANQTIYDRSATVTCNWKYGGVNGMSCSSASAEAVQNRPCVFVLVTSSTFAGCTYYGSVLSQSTSPYTSLSSDYDINTVEQLSIPYTGFTANQGPLGTLNVYGHTTLTRAPTITVYKNGTVQLTETATDWSSESATWYGPSCNLKVNPEDSIVAYITT